MKKIKFKGIASGDYSNFVWAVSKEDFIKIKGVKPDKYDKSPFVNGMYMIYPNDFYETGDSEVRDIEIVIK